MPVPKTARKPIGVFVQAILGIVPHATPRDAGRYVEVIPLDDKPLMAGDLVECYDRRGKKVKGKVEKYPGFEGSNVLIDTFAVV